MKDLRSLRQILLMSTILLSLLAGVSSAENYASTKKVLQNIPLSFEQNQGQVNSQVRFLSRTGRYHLYLTNNSAVLKLAGDHGVDAAVRTTLTNANPATRISGLEKQSWPTNYLLGPQSNWKTSVPNYAKVKFQDVYPGVDLVYYGTGQQLEYDFVIAGRSNPSVIKLQIDGAERLSIDQDGSLVLQTAAGTVRWKQPVAYQEIDGSRRLVNASYAIHGNQVAFNLGGYDKSRALIIDPVLVYGTYVDGSNGFDTYYGLHVDSAGYAYILGVTSSTDFPTTPGAYKRSVPSDLVSQIFITKLSQDGSYLVWSTILGGSGANNTTSPSGFAFDNSNNVYVVGSTVDQSYDTTTNSFTYYPSTYPTTAGAYNTTHNPTTQYFLTKLNNSGSALDYSTFLANQPNLQGYAVAVDGSGAAYVTGAYNRPNAQAAPFPCTPGAYQCTYAGNDDAFVMKFNPQGSALDYATLVGGSRGDDGQAIFVNTAGEATVGGSTYSSNYPITAGGLRQTDEGGFITTLNSAGKGLVFSTVLNHVLFVNLKRDSSGNYYVGGTAGTNLPVTSNAYQKSFPAVGTQIHLGFLTVMNPNGHLVYSSYIAGNPPSTYLEDTQIQQVSLSNVSVVGNRFNDTAFPVTDRTYEQDTCAFLAKFNPQASSGKASLLYSGCTPINKTDNLTIEQFRGVPLFDSADMYLDSMGDLYGINASGQTSPNAFQKSPPNPGSGDGSHVWIGKYNLTKSGPGGINLSQPYQWGPPDPQYVLYRATARSPQCSAGIAAMRLYISPGVWANTTPGATLNASIAFPKDGGYNTVIVAYDNCGHAFSLNVPEYVQNTTGAMGSIGLSSPVDRTVVSSPVHYVGFAQAPSCSKGIAAMRIYTAPGVAAYTTNGSHLDTYVTLSPGAHNTVVQAWDNCGHVYQDFVNITVR